MAERDLPTRLHVHRPARRLPPACPTDVQYQQGAPDWAPEFSRYLQDVVPRSVALERQRWRQWWTDDYVLTRVRLHCGDEATTAALRVLCDREPYYVVARELHHSVRWVIQQKCRVVRLVRQRYLPYPPRHAHERPVRDAHPDQAASPELES